MRFGRMDGVWNGAVILVVFLAGCAPMMFV